MSKNQSCLLVIITKCVWRNVCFMEFYASGTGLPSLCLRMTSRSVDGSDHDEWTKERVTPWVVPRLTERDREGAAVRMSSWKPRVGRLSSGWTLWLVIRGNRCKIIRVFCGVWCEVKLWGRYLCRPTLHRQEQVMWFVNWKELIGILTIDSIFSCN